jgi:hypothetical protein
VSTGDLEKVIDLQGRVAEAEHGGLSVETLGGALEQLANYATTLADAQAAADEVEASIDAVEADRAEAAALVDEEEISEIDIDMQLWYVEPACADALVQLHAELIYSRPASTSPKMELVLAFDEMFANSERLFVKTMTTSLRQQALHMKNVEKASRDTKVSRAPLKMGYVVPVGKREFFFSCLTEAEVLKLFDAVRQVTITIVYRTANCRVSLDELRCVMLCRRIRQNGVFVQLRRRRRELKNGYRRIKKWPGKCLGTRLRLPHYWRVKISRRQTSSKLVLRTLSKLHLELRMVHSTRS